MYSLVHRASHRTVEPQRLLDQESIQPLPLISYMNGLVFHFSISLLRTQTHL